MAKNKDFDDDNLDFDLDEFFPLEGDFDSSDDKSKTPTFKSYTKNLLKTAKTGLIGLADNLLPAAGDLVRELGFAKDTAVDVVKEKTEKLAESINKRKSGKSIKETLKEYKDDIVKDVIKAAKTGDFTFGASNSDLSFGDDFDFNDDSNEKSSDTSTSNAKNYDSDLEKVVNKSKESSEKISSIAIALEKSSQAQNVKLYSASESSSSARHLQSIGYISNIDENVSKIAKYFATVGLQSVSAQMEYSEKALLLQQDSIKLLNMIKDQTYTPPNNERDIGEGGLLSSIFGFGLDGSKWMETIMKNIGSTIEDSPIGAMLSSFGTLDSMGGLSPKSLIGDTLLNSIPGIFLDSKSRVKLEKFNNLLRSAPGLLNAKFNQMAMTSDNPILRTLSSFLGVKELSAKKIDLGIKDLNAKASFDKRFYHTVTDAIPGLLSKLLAIQTGQGELYYDFKAGTFKKGEQAVREYEYERDRVYASSMEYNEIRDMMTDKGEIEIREQNPDLSDEEKDEKAKIMRKDFRTITENIASVNTLFDPFTALNDDGYQKLISKGLIDPNNLALFIKIFGKKLNKYDKLTFSIGAQEVRQNLGDFYQRTAPEMIKSGSGGSSMIADAMIDERIKEAEKLLEYQDIGKHYDDDSLAQNIAKMKMRKGKEEIQMKYGGRAGTIKSTDITDIGQVANDGVSNTQLGVLNNIYELLLGGILTYPQEGIPIHLTNSRESYNKLKQRILEDKEIKKEQKYLEDEELRKSRQEQAILAYKTRLSTKGMVGEFFKSDKTTEFEDFKENINEKLQKVTDTGVDSIFKLLFGDKELTNKDIEGYEEMLTKAVDEGTIKISGTLSDILGKEGYSNTAKTKEAIKKENLDEKYKISDDATTTDKIKNYLLKIIEKIKQSAYGGEVDYDKLDELIKNSKLGEIQKEEKKKITTIDIPTKKGYKFSKDNTKPDKIDINLKDTNKYLKTIDSTVNKIHKYLTKKNININKDKSLSINDSKSIINSIDSLHNTNREFFEKVLTSGIFENIKNINTNIGDLKVNFSDFNLNLKDMTDNLSIMTAKLINGINIPGLPKDVIEALISSKSKGILGKIKDFTVSKATSGYKLGKRVVTDGLYIGSNFLKGLFGFSGGVGKGTGGLASGVGRGIGSIAASTGGIIGDIIKNTFHSVTSFIGASAKKVSNWITGPDKFKNLKAAGGKIIKTGGDLISSVFSGGGKGIKGVLSGLGEAASGIGGSIKNTLDKIFDFKPSREENVKEVDETLRREHMNSEDALNEILFEVTLIRHNLHTGGPKGILGNTYGLIRDIVSNVIKLPGKLIENYKTKEDSDLEEEKDKENISITDKIKDKFVQTKDKIKDKFVETKDKIKDKFKKKEDNYREGSFLDQKKDEQEEKMLETEISTNKNIQEIRDLLIDGKIKGKKIKEKEEKEENTSSTTEKGDSWFKKIGGWGTAGLAAGATLLGLGTYQATKGQSDLNKRTGLDEYGSTGDKLLSYTGIDSSSKYGFDGSELSFGERSAQSASLIHAPQALLSAKGMYKGGKAINKMVYKTTKATADVVTAGKSSSMLARITKNIPGFIKGLFDKIFSNKIIKKIVSPKMVSGIKQGLNKLLHPKLFKGVSEKIGRNLMKFLGPIGIALSVNDFITGMNNTSRYFTLGKGARPPLYMRVISGTANVLSSFLFGLIPADLIVTTLYNIFGSQEEKDYIREFKEFTEEKANILDVPSGPLGEFETKNFWQRIFKSGRRDAGLLGFGNDEEGVEEFKLWRDEKYRPVEEIREKISKEYGGDKITGKIPSSPEEKELQQAYREKFLSVASDLVDSIDKTFESKKEESVLDESEKTKPIDRELNKETFDESSKSQPITKNIPTTATATVAGKKILDSDKDEPDIDIPENIKNTSNYIKSGMSEVDDINSAVGLPPAKSVNNTETSSMIASAAGFGFGVDQAKMKEPKRINKDDFKLSTSKDDEKSSIGSPVLNDMNNITRNINTELDALFAIHNEQQRHNNISEEFYENAIKMISLLIETGRSQFDLDKSRNEILAKSFLVDVDPKYKRFIRKNTDTKELRTNEDGKVEGEGFFSNLFNKKSKDKQIQQPDPTYVALGPADKREISTSDRFDSKEKSFSGKEIDLTSYDSDSYDFDDESTNKNINKDELSKDINKYKKDNPIDQKVIENIGNFKNMSNFIQNSIFGKNSTHELYQTNIPVIYNGKRIGLKNIYIPKINKSGIRSGDVITEIKFLNGEKQYLVDNTGETTMSVDIDFSNSKFDKDTKSVILNMNVANQQPQTMIQSPTAKMAEIVSNGGR